jgi:hypothetical protein
MAGVYPSLQTGHQRAVEWDGAVTFFHVPTITGATLLVIRESIALLFQHRCVVWFQVPNMGLEVKYQQP